MIIFGKIVVECSDGVCCAIDECGRQVMFDLCDCRDEEPALLRDFWCSSADIPVCGCEC